MNEEMQVVLDKLATVTEEVNVDRVLASHSNTAFVL
jgi:hypothetical protein